MSRRAELREARRAVPDGERNRAAGRVADLVRDSEFIAAGDVVGLYLADDGNDLRLSSVPAVFVALVAAVGVTCLGAVGSLFTEWAPFSATSGLQLAGATGFLIFGYIASVNAMRFGEIAYVAPFRYTSLLVALVLGMVIFDEWPNLMALCGAGVVVATGLFTLYRESKLKIRQPMVPDRIR